MEYLPNQFKMGEFELGPLKVDYLLASKHFVERWCERVNEDSAYFRMAILQKKIIHLTYLGNLNRNPIHHLLIKIKDKFFVIIVNKNGVLKTILNEDIYACQIYAVNFSEWKIKFDERFDPRGPSVNSYQILKQQVNTLQNQIHNICEGNISKKLIKNSIPYKNLLTLHSQLIERHTKNKKESNTKDEHITELQYEITKLQNELNEKQRTIDNMIFDKMEANIVSEPENKPT